jgi:hypothetical protein
MMLLICFMSLSSLVFGQKASLQNIRYLRNLLMSGIVYSDSIRMDKHFESVVLCVSLDKGKVKEVHFWFREDSKSSVDVLKVVPVIKEKWRTKDTAVKYVYIPILLTFTTEPNEPEKSKGMEFSIMLNSFGGTSKKDTYFDKLLVIDDMIGRKIY